MIYECSQGHICFSKDNLDVCGMKGCGRSTLIVDPIDIKWFYKISETGLCINKNEIHKIIEDLGYGTADKDKFSEARKHIHHNWKNLRQTFLLEFDRPEPTVFDSPYIPGKKKSIFNRTDDES